MAIGPGVYDAEACTVLETTDARGVILMVLAGDRGSGFSVVAREEIADQLPRLLRSMVDQIETDL